MSAIRYLGNDRQCHIFIRGHRDCYGDRSDLEAHEAKQLSGTAYKVDWRNCAGGLGNSSGSEQGMNVDGTPYRSIWLSDDDWAAEIIDQTMLPHRFKIVRLENLEDAARAIEIMQVRGAPLIGATASYGFCLAVRENASDDSLERAAERLRKTRPTAINLNWAIEEMLLAVRNRPQEDRVAVAYKRAAEICDADVETNHSIGANGAELIKEAAKTKPGNPVNVLTHCNAGWLATVDWGTALSPIFQVHDAGIDVHVRLTKPVRAIRVQL